MKVPLEHSGFYPGNLEALKGRKDPEAVKAAAKEMESLFAYEMIKAMRQTVNTASESSFGTDTYMSMFDLELARLVAERGIGLQEALIRGMNRMIKGLDGKDHRNDKEVPSRPASRTPVETSRTATRAAVPAAGHAEEFGMPVEGRISSPFGMRRHPIYGDNRFHHGIDIAAREGAKIHPILAGKVMFSGEKSGYGKVVEVLHEDGFTSTYAHNSVNLVNQGDEVTPDTVLARVGSSGVSTGPHLHFEIKYNGERINPVTMLAER